MKIEGKGSILQVAVLCLVMILLPASRPAAQPTGAAAPRLLEAIPSQGDLVGRDAVVALSFDTPMDLESLAAASSFRPPVDFEVSGEAECLIVPVNLLSGGVEYSFSLEPGRAFDREGGVLEEGLEITFRTRGDGMILSIPSLGITENVVEASDPQGVASIIGFGVGHYPGTGRPGSGNIVLMAHSSGRIYFPFNRIGQLSEGDEFMIHYGGRVYIYSWESGEVIRDDELWIVDPLPYPVLTFFTCCAEDGNPSPTFHPPYRYMVRAALYQAAPSI